MLERTLLAKSQQSHGGEKSSPCEEKMSSNVIMCQRQWSKVQGISIYLYTTCKKWNHQACIEEMYLMLDIAVTSHPNPKMSGFIARAHLRYISATLSI